MVATKQRIFIKPGENNSNQIAYSQGLEMGEKTSEAVQKQLEQGVIEPDTY